MDKKHKQQKPNQKQAQMASSPSRQTPTTTMANQDYKKKEEEEEAFSQAMELVYGSVLPMTIHAAMELGVFDILGNAGPDATLSAEQIVTQMPTTNPDAPAMIDRICSLLVQHGMLGVSLDDNVRKLPFRRNYCLNSVSKYFARCNQDGVSLAPLMTLLHDKVYMDSWSVITHFSTPHFLISFFPFL